MMFTHVLHAEYCGDYRVWLSFNDGAEGEIDLSSELYGELFEPLKDKDFFKSFKIEGHTLTCSNEADFAPEFLRAHVVGVAASARNPLQMVEKDEDLSSNFAFELTDH